MEATTPECNDAPQWARNRSDYYVFYRNTSKGKLPYVTNKNWCLFSVRNKYVVCFHWRVLHVFTRASLLCAAGLTRRRWTLCLIHLLARLSHHAPPTAHSKAQHNCLNSISSLCHVNGWLMMIQWCYVLRWFYAMTVFCVKKHTFYNRSLVRERSNGNLNHWKNRLLTTPVIYCRSSILRWSFVSLA